MALYKYVARDGTGKRVTGSQEAMGADALLERLTQKGYVVTQLEPVTETAAPGWMSKLKFLPKPKIKEEVMIYFNLQLANMIQAGLSLLSSLEHIVYQVTNKRLRTVLKRVATGIEEGKSFSESLGQFPHIFDELFTSLVVVGESSGTLDMILERYSKLIEDQYDLKKKVKSALMYPIILIVVSVAVVSMMLTLVVPKFVEIFQRSGIPLPWPTRFLYAVSIIVRKYYLVVFIVCVLIFVMVKFLKTTRRGRRFFDNLKLRLPAFGTLIKKVILSRWARTLGTMIAGGVPILQALVISKKVAQNVIIERAIGEACVAVEKGGRIGDAFREDKEFPVEVVQMISAGEESGTLDKMLIRAADFYDKIIAYQVKRLSDMIEPTFLIFVGGLVAFIMISLLLPIFDMLKVLQSGGI